MSSSNSGLKLVLQRNQASAPNPAPAPLVPPPSTDELNRSSTATEAAGHRKGSKKKKKTSNHRTATADAAGCDVVKGEGINGANQTSATQPPPSTTIPPDSGVHSGANGDISSSSGAVVAASLDTATQPAPTLMSAPGEAQPSSVAHHIASATLLSPSCSGIGLSGIAVDACHDIHTSLPPSNDTDGDDLHGEYDEADLGTIGMDDNFSEKLKGG